MSYRWCLKTIYIHESLLEVSWVIWKLLVPFLEMYYRWMLVDSMVQRKPFQNVFKIFGMALLERQRPRRAYLSVEPVLGWWACILPIIISLIRLCCPHRFGDCFPYSTLIIPFLSLCSLGHEKTKCLQKGRYLESRKKVDASLGMVQTHNLTLFQNMYIN